MPAKSKQKLGLWLIGGCGGVGATVAIGIEAIRKKLCPPVGLIGHMPPFDKLGLSSLDQWVVGGHEVRDMTFEDAANELHRKSNILTPELIAKCRPWLQSCQRNLRPGSAFNCGPTIDRFTEQKNSKKKQSAAAWIEQLADDIRSFARRHKLAHVVVINVASTEPCLHLNSVHQTWKTLEPTLNKKTAALPASSLYAIAAIEAGASYINFTPSIGVDVPAIRQLAEQRGTAYMGADGKTGETLMKSVLAPMFAARNLHVLSWVGHNIFGNRDGEVLDDPRNKAAKTKSKDHLVADVLGYSPKTLVTIEYIESMHDWKTAWDHIHFAGFLGTKMALQFTWQGCDSILAAPLVIELARFAERAARDNHVGALTHLSCFFKSPIGVRDQNFANQYESLLNYARSKKLTPTK